MRPPSRFIDDPRGSASHWDLLAKRFPQIAQTSALFVDSDGLGDDQDVLNRVHRIVYHQLRVCPGRENGHAQDDGQDTDD